MAGENDRGSKSFQVFGIHISNKWGTGGAFKGKNKESGNGDGAGMKFREVEVWEGLK